MRAPIAILLALLLAAAAVIAVWFAATDDPEAPTSKHTLHDALDTTAAARDTTRQEANTPPATTANRTTANQIPTQRPHAPDAKWIDLLVVNRDGEPVPRATVNWHDLEAGTLVEDSLVLTSTQQTILWKRPCKLAQQFGWSTTADNQGRARITIAPGNCIAGTAPGLFGKFEIEAGQATPPSVYQLVLLPDSSIHVAVVDQGGQPCANVPITLVALDKDGDLHGEFGWDAMALSDADGHAVLAHTQDNLAALGDRPNASSNPVRTFVHLLLPGYTDPGIEVDLRNPPQELLVVPMPPFGSARARVEIPGEALFGGHQMVITGDGSTRLDGYLMSRPSEDGWTYFDHVPVGKRLRAHVATGNNINELFDSPRTAGEMVDVVIRPAQNTILLKVRLVDEDGQPVPDLMFTTLATGTGMRPVRTSTTNSEGRAVITVRKEQDAPRVELESAEILPSSNQMGLGHGSIGPRILHNGINDLGDVTLDRGTFVASGRLMTGDKPCTTRPNILIERFDPNAAEGKRHQADLNWQTVVRHDDDGRFEVHARLPAKWHYRLVVFDSDTAPIDPVPFALGETDIVIQVLDGHPLAMTFLLPEGVDPDDLECKLLPPAHSKPSLRLQGTLEGSAVRTHAEQCSLSWSGVPTETYTVSIGLWTEPEPLVRIENVTLPLPDSGDPRLVDVDLRKLVQVIAIRLLDRDGQPLEGYGAVFPNEQMAKGKWRGHNIYESARLLVPPGPVDMQVAIEGYQPTPVRGVGPTFEARMHPWPAVQIELPNPADLPPGTSLSLHIEAMHAQDGLWSSKHSHDSLRELFGIASYDTNVQGKTIAYPIGEGPHRIRMWLNKDTHGFEIQGLLPAQILSTDAAVRVRIPNDRWQAVLAEYRQFIK